MVMVMKSMRPPAVMRFVSQVSTLADPLETERKLRSGKSMVTAKHQIGTPFLVHLRRKRGARPSMERE